MSDYVTDELSQQLCNEELMYSVKNKLKHVKKSQDVKIPLSKDKSSMLETPQMGCMVNFNYS